MSQQMESQSQFHLHGHLDSGSKKSSQRSRPKKMDYRRKAILG